MNFLKLVKRKPNFSSTVKSLCVRMQSNKLLAEKSPYLLQHAHNPVNWYPWGEETFEKAKAENKIIFLSVGYSTCHWCHVMERESFQNHAIAKILNDNFVSVKVDREERPDVDRVYMGFIQATTGRGGWPMTVWLTPDLKPIVGGTYFPPEDRYFGQPGLRSLLQHIVAKWRENPAAVFEQSSSMLNALQQVTNQQETSLVKPLTLEPVETCFKMLAKIYDKLLGGFSSAPKFPQPSILVLLLKIYSLYSDSAMGKTALDMCTHTLDMLAVGGINDHIGNGFHRYSTDRDWHVPHFEKMLYDQAQLLTAYSFAYKITKNENYAQVIDSIVAYVSSNLQHKSGGFFSAEDADSYENQNSHEKKEGAFYVWKQADIEDLLPNSVPNQSDLTFSDVFCYHYGVIRQGNVEPYQDPHDELKGKNVLIVRGSVEKTAHKFGLPDDQVKDILRQCKSILNEARSKRPRPHRDTKFITAWNGLMISGLCHAYQATGNSDYLNKALDAGKFVQKCLLADHQLLRSCYLSEDNSVAYGNVKIQGFAEDYAFIIRSFIDLYESSFQEEFLELAEQLQHKQNDLFLDVEKGGYFNNVSDDKSIILRIKEDQDGAEPCSSSVSASNLVRLGYMLDLSEFLSLASKTFKAFAEQLRGAPITLPEMVSAVMLHHSHPTQVVICGDRGSETQQMIRKVHELFVPNSVCLYLNVEGESYLAQKVPTYQDIRKTAKNIPFAVVCKNFTCGLPATSYAELVNQLTQKT